MTDHSNRLPALDSLRGFAALFVLMYHITMQSTPHSAPAIAFKQVFSLGWTGVDLFFVLSGFLITSLLVAAKGSTNYFRVFYARRGLRILPLYYATLIVLFGVPLFVRLPGDFVVPFRDQIWFWTYLQNFHWLGAKFAGFTGPLWSLAIEEQFYLVWPLLILLASRRRALLICAGCVLLSVFYRIYAIQSVPHLDTYYVTQARLDGLSIGSAIALVSSDRTWLLRIRKFTPAIAIGATALIAATGRSIHGAKLPLFPALYSSVALLYGCLLIVALTTSFEGPSRILKSRILRFYGRYSYALYVIHSPLMTVLWHVGVTPNNLSLGGSDLVGQILYTFAIAAPATGLALLSWHILEKHFLKLKRHFEYDMGGYAKAPLVATPSMVEQ
ncbi:MAG: acyltransferase [Gemmatimonadaceae bacterium]